MRRTLLRACALLVLAGCGSSIDLEPPAAQLRFPPGPCQTDSFELVVAGTASDDKGVVEVVVNGVRAESDDGFETWWARIPLLRGANPLTVQVLDIAGKTTQLSGLPSIENVGSLLSAPNGVTVDPDEDVAYLIDSALDAVIVVDLASGAREVVSDATHGLGPGFDSPAALARRASGSLILLDPVAGALIEIDPQSGDRTARSGAGLGEGPALTAGLEVAVEDAAAFVLVGFPAALLRVDLATGDRTVVSDAVIGDGPTLFFPRGLALDSVAGRAFVANGGVLLEVDLASGDRIEIAGTGPALLNPTGVTFDAGESLLIVSDSGQRALVEVLLPGGERSVRAADEFVTPLAVVARPGGALVADSGLDALVEYRRDPEAVTVITRSRFGNGDALLNPRDLEVGGDTAYVADSQGGLFAIELADGTRRLISGPGVGDGPNFAIPVALALQPDGVRALVVDSGRGVLFGVDLATGDRAILDGTGPELDLPNDVAFDSLRGHALLLDGGAAVLFTVDAVTGGRTLLSGATRGEGPLLRQPRALVFDPVGDRVLLLDAGTRALLEIHPETGDRMVIEGGGPEPVEPARMAFDPTTGEILLADRGLRALLRIDAETGERTLISDGTRGGGPRLIAPQSVAIEPGKAPLLIDSGLAALLSVEPGSGDRVVRSK